ncbi:MAG: FkbM family methyltransferase [Candidatus Sumerlaea chitinivorans]|nr:FkbM family methyltransferase [Candidatus Sumerlaea chitinivorans]
MSLKEVVKRLLRPYSDHWVYTARRGLAKGMRLKGGLQFVPSLRTSKKEQHFLNCGFEWEGKTIYDVGANWGITTLFFASRVGPRGTVYAFEPVPDLLEKVNDNVRLNNMVNVTTFPYALGDYDGSSELVFFPEATGISTMDPEFMIRNLKKHRGVKCHVVVRKLDSIVQELSLKPPDLIKIDVEGFELQVLRGAEHLLSTHLPVLILEVHGATALIMAENKSKVFSFLNALGYRIFDALNGFIEIAQEQASSTVGNMWHCVARDEQYRMLI